MKTNNWLNLDHHDYVAIDLEDGRRVELREDDVLITAVDYVAVNNYKTGKSVLYPNVKVSQIIKKLKDQYCEK